MLRKRQWGERPMSPMPVPPSDVIERLGITLPPEYLEALADHEAAVGRWAEASAAVAEAAAEVERAKAQDQEALLDAARSGSKKAKEKVPAAAEALDQAERDLAAREVVVTERAQAAIDALVSNRARVICELYDGEDRALPAVGDAARALAQLLNDIGWAQGVREWVARLEDAHAPGADHLTPGLAQLRQRRPVASFASTIRELLELAEGAPLELPRPTRGAARVG